MLETWNDRIVAALLIAAWLPLSWVALVLLDSARKAVHRPRRGN